MHLAPVVRDGTLRHAQSYGRLAHRQPRLPRIEHHKMQRARFKHRSNARALWNNSKCLGRNYEL